MKYYIGRIAINCHQTFSSVEYASDILIAAPGEVEAQRLLEKRASTRGELTTVQANSGAYEFPADDGNEDGSVSQFAYSLREITPVTFEDLQSYLEVVGNVDKGALQNQKQSEAVKTVARRLGDNLQKQGTPVAHSALLHAVSASLGETDWQVLLNKQPGSPARAEPESQWPTGNWPKGPLGDASKIPFEARINAIWLTHGDIALAARLLHVAPGALLDTLEHPMEADTAFCGRHPDWKPEHSLAMSLGMAPEMGRLYHVEWHGEAGGRFRLKGFVGKEQLFALDNRENEFYPTLRLVKDFPTEFQQVNTAAACLNALLSWSYAEMRHESGKRQGS